MYIIIQQLCHLALQVNKPHRANFFRSHSLYNPNNPFPVSIRIPIFAISKLGNSLQQNYAALDIFRWSFKPSKFIWIFAPRENPEWSIKQIKYCWCSRMEPSFDLVMRFGLDDIIRNLVGEWVGVPSSYPLPPPCPCPRSDGSSAFVSHQWWGEKKGL